MTDSSVIRIYPLPSSLTNQIAAGEVIERPASVVKELLENALDAKAGHINITIEAGGVQLIEISDDGVGIHPDDLPLAVMSHATSKIRILEDLFSVKSLGFRGEALASISAVSRFSIISKIADCDQGYELTFDEIKHTAHVLPKAHAKGTSIMVRDLFFNTPVRRKFLASEKTEWIQIENVVKRMALSRFDVAFQLKNKTVLHLPAAHHEMAIEARVRKIFGAAFLEQSEKIDVQRDGIRLWGWAGLPSLMRSQNDLQYFYLNGRMIRDKLISHAIRAAYESSLYPGRQPMFLLYLEMPPEQVDVNVHPTKHEVRFQEPRQIHDLIYSHLLNLFNVNKTEGLSVKNNKVEEISPVYELSSMTSKATNTSLETFLDIQWLEWPYCLIKFQQNFLLCDYIRLYQSLCRNRFLKNQAQNEIVSRPLLLPVRLTLPSDCIEKIILEIPRLETWGFSLNRADEQTLFIRAFPALMPHLNFNQWIQHWQFFLEKKDYSDEALLESLILANQPVWPIASHDLKAVLDDFQHCLIQNDITMHLKQSYRMMTLGDWEKVLKASS